MDRRTEAQIQEDWKDFLSRNKEVSGKITIEFDVSTFVPKTASSEDIKNALTNKAKSICPPPNWKVLSLDFSAGIA